MPRYKITINGDVGFKTVKEEDIENFLAKYPNAVLAEETPPAENFQNGDAETDASVTPGTSQASNGDSTSDDGLLEEQKQDSTSRISKTRVINFKGGKQVREDVYLADFAGTESSNGQLYPETFDEYAKLYNTEPIQITEQTLPSPQAEALGRDIDNVNQKSPAVKNEVGITEFNLTTDWRNRKQDYSLKVDMPQYRVFKDDSGNFVPYDSDQTEGSPFYMEGDKATFVNSYEDDLKNYLGEKKYNAWICLRWIKTKLLT